VHTIGRKTSNAGPMRPGTLASVLGLLAGCGAFFAASAPVQSLPLYARQTGQPCATCHTAFPELTPYGRRFKLLGYTAGGTRCRDAALRRPDEAGDVASMKDYLNGSAAGSPEAASNDGRYLPPISFMVIPSFTHTAKAQDPANLSAGVDPNNNWQLQTASVFAGGQIYCDVGAFVQATHDPNAFSPFFLDNTDIRYARQTRIFGLNAIIGATVNNNPTVQDVWNTTPAWGFPQQQSEVTPPPVANSTMIEGAWSGTVVGTSTYMLLDDKVYAEFGYYRSMPSNLMANLGQDPGGDRIDGAAPYWRLAFEKNWDQHSLMFGTFGMMANIYPGNDRTFGSDRVTDWGIDSQYQYIGDVHGLTTKVTYIKEKQNHDATGPLGFMSADNPVDYLSKFKASATYHYEIPPLTGSRIALTGSYFNIVGTADATLYSPNSQTGSPNTAGWIGELAWIPFNRGNLSAWPWFNMRVGLQYTAYTKFDGSTTNIDGAGRKASDNNTLYSYVWTAF